jgi:hypothetical protein
VDSRVLATGSWQRWRGIAITAWNSNAGIPREVQWLRKKFGRVTVQAIIESLVCREISQSQGTAYWLAGSKIVGQVTL